MTPCEGHLSSLIRLWVKMLTQIHPKRIISPQDFLNKNGRIQVCNHIVLNLSAMEKSRISNPLPDLSTQPIFASECFLNSTSNSNFSPFSAGQLKALHARRVCNSFRRDFTVNLADAVDVELARWQCYHCGNRRPQIVFYSFYAIAYGLHLPL